MRKLAIIFIALLLSGCVIDTSATNQMKVDSSFQFNEDEMYIDIRHKAVRNYIYSDVYSIYTTSEQAAYLLSGASEFSTKLNNVEVGEVIFSIDEKIETGKDTIYGLNVGFKADQLVQLGTSITSLNISYKGQPIINFSHSPIIVMDDYFAFEIIGGYKETPEDVGGLGLQNNSKEDLMINQLYIEGINGKRLIIKDEPTLFKRKYKIRLPFNRELVEQHHIEGVIGVYATLEDGREIFLTEAPFVVESYKEQMIEQLTQLIENK